MSETLTVAAVLMKNEQMTQDTNIGAAMTKMFGSKDWLDEMSISC